jgi:septal ring factor EnvC (AmiA/AmiB activator)
MSETPDKPGAGPDTPTPAPPATPSATEPTDWKAESRKWEALAKKNKDAADKLAALEEAAKTEDQKRLERIAELEKQVAEYEEAAQVAKWKAEVAEAAGVPAEALAGSTREEIEAHAEVLKKLIVPADGKKGAIGPYVPSEGTGEGALPLNGDPLERALRTKLGIA